jgi:hypothetical protein
MATSKPRSTDQRIVALILAAAVWAGLGATVPAGARSDDNDALEQRTDDEIAGPVRVPQPRSSVANELFDKLVFGATGPDAVAAVRKRLEELLQQNLERFHGICELDDAQKLKLRLAGRGDIQRLLNGVDQRREAIQYVRDDEITPEIRQRLVEIGMPLRQSLQSGSFDDQSLFTKTLRLILNRSQLAKYEALLEIERAGGKVTIAPPVPGVTSTVSRVRLKSTGQEDHLLSYLRHLPGLVYLDLEGTQVNDDSLAALDRLTGMRQLVLRRTRINGSGLAYLAALRGLISLDLFDTEVTDAALVHLESFKYLNSLTLTGTKVTDAGMETLGRLTTLRHLLLDGTAITDAGLAQIAKLTNLNELSLAGTAISDVGLAHLESLKELRRLNVVATRVGDAGLASVEQWPSLEVLLLVKTRVTVQGVTDLQEKMPRLSVGY